MKNIKKGETIKRVSDTEAIFFVKNGWEYCSKSEWKKYRGVKNKNDITQEEVLDNISDKKKRKMRKENKRKKYQNN
jgi:hypothetical protein